jgi:L,D-transpeptidase ErfK/SrfK
MTKTLRFLPLLALAVGALVLPGSANAAKTYDKDYVGKTEIYRASYEDTLVHLARKHGLGFVEMRAANPTLDPWIPGEGARVVLPLQNLLPDAPREGIVLNLAEMKLYLFEKPGQAPIIYSISPGREGLNTPIGATTVNGKKEGPTWRPTARMRKEDPTLKEYYPPGPENPLGTHALYLGWPEMRIHGTNKPYAIGRRASSGCIRMYPESIRDIYNRVPVGTKVTSVDQPVKVGWVGDKMYVEVSPTQEQSLKIEQIGELKSYEITAEDMKRITRKAGPHADKIDWEAVRKAVREHRGYPVAILDSKAAKGTHVADETEAELNAEIAQDLEKKAKVEAKKAAAVQAPPVQNKQEAVKGNDPKMADAGKRKTPPDATVLNP